jgi:hypothetical protein
MKEKLSVIPQEKLGEITLNSRLDAINEAQKRARVALFFSTLAAGIILAALWNLYLSWDRQWADVVRPEPWGREQLIAQQIKSWMESQLVGVPLLGLRLSVSDTAFLGSIGLFIFSFYYCMCMRRENHEIGSLLVEVNNERDEIRYLALLRIRSSMIFNSITDDDSPFRSLSGQRHPARHIRFSSSGFKFLVYLPALTVWLIVVSDIYYAFIYESPFVLNVGSVWNNLPTPFRYQLILADAFALIVSYLIFGFCRGAARFHEGTREITEELKKSLDSTGTATSSSNSIAQPAERRRDTESQSNIKEPNNNKRDE